MRMRSASSGHVRSDYL